MADAGPAEPAPWRAKAFNLVEPMVADHAVAESRPHPAGPRSSMKPRKYPAPEDAPEIHCKADTEKKLLRELRKAEPFVSVEPFGNSKTADFASLPRHSRVHGHHPGVLAVARPLCALMSKALGVPVIQIDEQDAYAAEHPLSA